MKNIHAINQGSLNPSIQLASMVSLVSFSKKDAT